MPLVRIENVGAIGVINDLPAHELPPEAWSDALNIRFNNNKAMKIKGDVAVYGTPTVAPHHVEPWTLTTDYRWLYAGTAQIYYISGGSHTNATRYTTTPGDNDYTAGTRPIWTGGNLHGVPILNHDNFTDYPQQWDNALSRFKDLDNWQANTYAKVMRPYQNFLVGLHIKKSATEYPYTVKWSHPADPGTVPTSWDETDATKQAGEQTIAQSGGFLVDCAPLAGQNILYKQDAIWAMQYIGGTFVFNFQELSSTIGALTPRCIKEFYRRHLIVGQNDIVLFDGVQPQSIISKKTRKWFFNQLHETHWDKTIVTMNYPRREIWIAYVEAGATSEYLTHALIWNWDDNTLTIKELPDLSYINYGHVDDDTATTFDGASGTFDAASAPFGDSGTSPADYQLLFAKAYSSAQFLHGDENYDSNGTNYTSYLERTGLAVAGNDRQGNLKVDPYSVKFVRAIFPKIISTGSPTVQISVGMQDDLNGAVRWDGPHDFVVGTDLKIDTALSGKYLAIRIEDSSNIPWELTGYTLDMDIISGL